MAGCFVWIRSVVYTERLLAALCGYVLCLNRKYDHLLPVDELFLFV